MQKFVYLNTAKPLEKQIFAAGHELGHLWNVADIIWNAQLEKQFPRKENEEAAMNRFSAELLMPEKTFYQSASPLLKSYQTADGKIMISSLCQNNAKIILSWHNQIDKEKFTPKL